MRRLSSQRISNTTPQGEMPCHHQRNPRGRGKGRR